MSNSQKLRAFLLHQHLKVWQRILGAARAHGIDANPRQPFLAKETETAPQALCTAGQGHIPTPESTQGEAEAMSALAAERFYERMTAELEDTKRYEWSGCNETETGRTDSMRIIPTWFATSSATRNQDTNDEVVSSAVR